jgi:hypothetical protein
MGFLHSPFVKTFTTVLIGSLAPIGLAAVQHPTGGLATALANHPEYGGAWWLLTLLAQNVYTSWQLNQKEATKP